MRAVKVSLVLLEHLIALRFATPHLRLLIELYLVLRHLLRYGVCLYRLRQWVIQAVFHHVAWSGGLTLALDSESGFDVVQIGV